MSHYDYKISPEQVKRKPSSRHPLCTNYVECHDKNWNHEARDRWRRKSIDTLKAISSKHPVLPIPKATGSVKETEWYKVPK